MRKNQYLERPVAPSPPLAEIAGEIRYEVVVAQRNIAVIECTIRRKEEWLDKWRDKPASMTLYRRIDEVKESLEDLRQELLLNETRLSIAKDVYERSANERKAS